MSAEPNLTDRDIEQLSAYIDGALDASERAALEARLESDAALRRELDALRQTVALVKALPRLSAPRSFALTPAMLTEARPVDAPAPAPPRRVVRFPALSLVSAAASMVMIFMGLLLILDDQTADTALPAQPAQMSAPMDAPAALPSPDTVAVAATKTAVVVEEALIEAVEAPDVETFSEALEAAADVAAEPELFALSDEVAEDAVEDAENSAGVMALEMPAPPAAMPEAEPPSIARQMLPEDEVFPEAEAEEAVVEATPAVEPDPTPDLLAEVIADPEATVSRDVLGSVLILAGLGLLAFVAYTVYRRRSPSHDR